MASQVLSQNSAGINQEKPGFTVQQFADYQSLSAGALRTMQTIQDTIKLSGEFNKLSPTMKSLEGRLGTGIGALDFARLLPSANDTYKAAKAYIENNQADGVSRERKLTVLFREATDAVAAWSRSFTFIKSCPLIGAVADTAGVLTDTTDLAIATADYTQSTALEEKSTGKAKEIFAHTKRYNMLRIAAAVTAVVSGVLGLAIFALGASLLPAVAMISLSLTSTLLAIWRDNYKDVESI